MPNAGRSSSVQAFFGRDNIRSAVETSVPLSHQMVDVYEIVDYTDPLYKEQGGALMTLSLDTPGLLEYRANPYGRRLYRVQEWNGTEFELFPQTDFEGWEDIWHASKEVLYRMVRALRRSPNGKLVVDSNSAANADELDGGDGKTTTHPSHGLDLGQDERCPQGVRRDPDETGLA